MSTIGLTPEQWRLIEQAGDRPVHIEDPETYQSYVLVRADVYERGGVLKDYMHITLLKPDALTILDRYGVQSCLLEREEPLATVLGALPGWRRVYSDKLSALFVRASFGGKNAQN